MSSRDPYKCVRDLVHSDEYVQYYLERERGQPCRHGFCASTVCTGPGVRGTPGCYRNPKNGI